MARISDTAPATPLTGEIRERALDLLDMVIKTGLTDAAETLSQVTGRNVILTSPAMKLVPLKTVPQMVGGADAPALAIYLGVTGSLSAHFFFLFSLESSRLVATLLTEEPYPAEQPLDSMAYSALGEMGNIVGSSFLGSIARVTDFSLLPTVPQVVEDFAGSILEESLAALSGTTDEAVIVQAGFSESGTEIHGHFLFLPDSESLKLLLKVLLETTIG